MGKGKPEPLVIQLGEGRYVIDRGSGEIRFSRLAQALPVGTRSPVPATPPDLVCILQLKVLGLDDVAVLKEAVDALYDEALRQAAGKAGP
jgi:hypothetical protein